MVVVMLGVMRHMDEAPRTTTETNAQVEASRTKGAGQRLSKSRDRYEHWP
jgi:hypothetical protein